MATDASSLLAQASCYACYASNPYTLQLMRLALLRQWLLLLDPSADTTPQALLEYSRCYLCFGSGSGDNPFMLQIFRLVLLKQALAGSDDVGRITEEEDPRITEEGAFRIIE